MTAYVTLRCDYEQPADEDGIGICPGLLVAPRGMDLDSARTYAADLGWVADQDGRDLCGCHKRARPTLVR